LVLYTFEIVITTGRFKLKDAQIAFAGKVSAINLCLTVRLFKAMTSPIACSSQRCIDYYAVAL